MRRTKIIATLGPASQDGPTLEAMIRAGVDLVRINAAHGDRDAIERLARAARSAAERVGRDVGVLLDLAGPKIRIGRFRGGSITLAEGDRLVLDTTLGDAPGEGGRVGVNYPALPSDVRPGDRLLLDDGQLVLSVTATSETTVECRVESGGVLSDHKGLNRQGGGLSAACLTPKDREDIRTAAAIGADYVALSFARDADDVREARRLLETAGSTAGVVAKIERAEALANVHELCAAAEGVMVARGDLAVEIGDWELAGAQKRILRLAHETRAMVITATQMMESMVHSPVPTRAEVLDVANAVLDGTDAVMLSAESAVGRYPVRAVEAMARVCVGAEQERVTTRPRLRRDERWASINEALAMAAVYTASGLGARAIAALTESGTTALLCSRVRTAVPIYALTRNARTRARVTLMRGVVPVDFDPLAAGPDVARAALRRLVEAGAVGAGDLVVVTRGDREGVAGGTNTLKILRVGDDVSI
jgi:pyruvate kinase